jgi:hypothetical protein
MFGRLGWQEEPLGLIGREDWGAFDQRARRCIWDCWDWPRRRGRHPWKGFLYGCDGPLVRLLVLLLVRLLPRRLGIRHGHVALGIFLGGDFVHLVVLRARCVRRFHGDDRVAGAGPNQRSLLRFIIPLSADRGLVLSARARDPLPVLGRPLRYRH